MLQPNATREYIDGDNSDSLFGYRFGPIFGAGADLSISSDCNENTDSYSNFPHSYGELNQYPVSLAGDYHFKVDDYEVFIPRTTQQLNGR